MHAPLPAAAAYVCTVFICCLVIFRTVALWYYKPQRLWWHLVFDIVFLFLTPGLIVAALIGCMKHRIIHPPQDTPQPIAVLRRSLLAIVLAAEVCKAAILKELTNRKLDPISVGFCRHVREGPLGGPHYYSSRFSTPELRYWAILLYIAPATTMYPSSNRKFFNIYLICYNSSL